MAALPVATSAGGVRPLLSALRAALAGSGPPVAPHPADRPPDQRFGTNRPLVPEEDASADPTAVLVATSGSTGPPKVALLPASALLASASATHDRLGGPGTWLLALPAHTVAGVMVCVRALTSGRVPAVCDLTGGFTAELFTAAAGELGGHRRYTALVATQLDRLLGAGGPAADALRRFDGVLVGGGPLPRRLRDQATAGGVRIVETYGSSETSGGCVYDGVPLDGVTVDLDPEDRIRVTGPVVARGYRSSPGHPSFTDTPTGRRFVTDDVGRLDGGRLVVLGRVDDVVISGGFKVSPDMATDVLREQPGVRDAAVVAVTDEHWGHRLVAFVVPDDDEPGRTLAAAGLREAVVRSLGRWAAPDVRLVPALPVVAPGKLDRTALVAIVTGEKATRSARRSRDDAR